MKFDCVVLIDCWSQNVSNVMMREEINDEKIESQVRHKLHQFYNDFQSHLEKYQFENILHALYKNKFNGSILNDIQDTLDLSTVESKFRWQYKTHPLNLKFHNGKINSLTSDEATVEDIKKLTSGKKILVCGKSFGACVQGRPAGVIELLHMGYDVYMDTRLVFREGKTLMACEIDSNTILKDLVVWTAHRETADDGLSHVVPFLYRAIGVHENLNGLALDIDDRLINDSLIIKENI